MTELSSPVDYTDERHALLFAAEMSARYHRRRAAFLEKTNLLLNLVTLFSGTAAFVSLYTPGTGIAKALTVVLTAIGIIRIVYSPLACAMRHKDWLSRWLAITREIQTTPRPTLEQIEDWTRRRFAIEGECLIEMRALQADCYNRTVRAMDLEETHNYRVRIWHRFLCQVVSFENAFEGRPREERERRSLFGRRSKQLDAHARAHNG
jgi:hypothetical protein